MPAPCCASGTTEGIAEWRRDAHAGVPDFSESHSNLSAVWTKNSGLIELNRYKDAGMRVEISFASHHPDLKDPHQERAG